jgi:putative ABC transport system substrate-binding protein
MIALGTERMVTSIERRRFIGALGGATFAWPLAARAQRPAMPVIGFVNGSDPKRYARPLKGFLKGLEEAGYSDGRNVAIEYRWAEDHNDRLPEMVADLVRRQVAVIAATSTPAAVATKGTTTTIPIVFETGSDPIGLGLVASLNRPGGNVTGVTQINVELAPKRLEVLHELLPTAHVMALLVHPDDPAIAESTASQVLAAAGVLGLELHVLKANSESDFDAVFAKLIELRAGGLVISGGPFFISRSEQLAALTLRYAVPAIYQYREFIEAGGLMSYGSDITESYRLTGNYTGRILNGDKPADLPVQQATKVELRINLRTAKALGISVPLTLLGRVNEVIE